MRKEEYLRLIETMNQAWPAGALTKPRAEVLWNRICVFDFSVADTVLNRLLASEARMPQPEAFYEACKEEYGRRKQEGQVKKAFACSLCGGSGMLLVEFYRAPEKLPTGEKNRYGVGDTSTFGCRCEQGIKFAGHNGTLVWSDDWENIVVPATTIAGYRHAVYELATRQPSLTFDQVRAEVLRHREQRKAGKPVGPAKNIRDLSALLTFGAMESE